MSFEKILKIMKSLFISIKLRVLQVNGRVFRLIEQPVLTPQAGMCFLRSKKSKKAEWLEPVVKLRGTGP